MYLQFIGLLQINYVPGHLTPTKLEQELVMPIPLWEQFSKLVSIPVHERWSSHMGWRPLP